MPEQMTFEGLLEAVPDALIAVDPSGAIRFVNHQAELLFGYDHDELVGQPLETLVPEWLRKTHAAQRESYFSDPLTRPLGSGLDLSGRHQDGTEIPVDISLSHLDTVDGPLVIASVRDMTERKKAEAGRLGAERMSAVVEFSGETILSSTLDGIITSYNRAAEKVFGYTGDEIVGKPASLLSPKDRADEASTILATIRTGQPVMNFETIRVRKDGTVFPVSLTVSPIFDHDGTVIGASAIPRDITSQKHAFDAAQRMAAIIENSDDAIIGKTLDGIITNWNPAAERMFGYSSSEILGKPAGLLSPEDRPHEMTTILAKIRAGQAVERLETTRLRKDGTAFTVSLTVSPIHDPNGAIVGASTITRDVTKQRQAFEAARSMIESSLDSLVSISPEGMITDVNEATVKVTGIPREELIGTAFSDYFTEPEKANEIYQRVFAEGMAVDYPLTMRHRDGSLTDVLYNAAVQRDSGGNVLGVFAAARDVTKQRQAFEAARSMIESSLDSLVAISPEGMITDVNEATAKVTGIPRELLIGTAFSDYFTDPKKANAIYQLVFEQGMAVDYPLTMRHRDGTLSEVLYNAAVQRDAGGKVLGVFAAARDVTKQRQAGAQYARSLIEAGLDPLVAISPEGMITDVNEATVTVTGIPREELIGTAFSDYFTEPDKANEGYQRAFAQGSVTDYPLTIRRPNGTLSEVLYNASVYRDEAGDGLGVFAAARDVTEQKLAQSELAKQAKELNRLAELERFQRLTVGRELKMIELKKEIESLRRLVQTDGGELGDQR